MWLLDGNFKMACQTAAGLYFFLKMANEYKFLLANVLRMKEKSSFRLQNLRKDI